MTPHLHRLFVLAVVVAVLVSHASGRAGGETTAAAHTAPPPHRTLTAWLATWDHGAGYRQVLAHASEFRMASPYWLSTTANPRVIAGSPNHAWVAALHAKGIKVVPTVGSTWPPDKAQQVFTSPSLTRAHVTALVRLVRSNGFDGIDLDYEGFTWPSTIAQTKTIRHAFANFVAELCTRLHEVSKTCSITLGPVTADGPWIASDYRAIGRAADLVRLMCYDLHGPWSKPGPVSTTPWTARVLTYAVSQIPRSKIELDVPTYGYQWPKPAGGDASLSWAQTWHLIALHNVAHVQFDSAAGEATFHWRSGGRLHTVWFETPRSLAGRVALANSFQVHSLGFWLLGTEAPGDWNVLRGLHL
jgi:spore germination protein YaaH